VSKQVIYIIQAHLLLAALAGTYLFLRQIPPNSSVEEHLNLLHITDTLSMGRKTPASFSQGQTLFLSKCASCHAIDRKLTGPALRDFEERGPWSDRKKLYQWIKDPSTFLQKDNYTSDLKKQYVSLMTAFPTLTNEEIDAIVDYINYRAETISVP
jgi:mono/diheme cytochrome c family protein